MDLSSLVDAGGAVLSAIGGASLLAAILPRPAGGAWAAFFKVLDLLAANWMQARNTPKPVTVTIGAGGGGGGAGK